MLKKIVCGVPDEISLRVGIATMPASVISSGTPPVRLTCESAAVDRYERLGGLEAILAQIIRHLLGLRRDPVRGLGEHVRGPDDG